jgi:hypothetical protein
MRPTSDDPLEEALRPPPDETPEQRAERLAREEQARQKSLQIDMSIKKERQAAQRRKKIVTLLLLGQSESGEFHVFSVGVGVLRFHFSVICFRLIMYIYIIGKSTTLRRKSHPFPFQKKKTFPNPYESRISTPLHPYRLLRRTHPLVLRHSAQHRPLRPAHPRRAHHPGQRSGLALQLTHGVLFLSRPAAGAHEEPERGEEREEAEWDRQGRRRVQR